MKRFIVIIGILIIIVFGAVWLVQKDDTDITPPTRQLRVVASFYPLAHFAHIVGGKAVTVTQITPAGIEPHDFEPTPQDITAMQQADIILFMGAGLDPWAEKMQDELTSKGIIVIEVSSYFSLLEGEGDEHEEGQFDPHVWLDPLNAKRMVEIIRDALADRDRENADFYAQNAQDYLLLLDELDRDFQAGLASCVHDTLVVSHNAFQYLANRYNLAILPLSGLSPNQEPSPRRLAEIAQIAREKRITYIFFETLASPKVSQTVAQEIGAQTLVLNPLEGLTLDEKTQGKTYLSVMRDNLANIQIALECS